MVKYLVLKVSNSWGLSVVASVKRESLLLQNKNVDCSHVILTSLVYQAQEKRSLAQSFRPCHRKYSQSKCTRTVVYSTLMWSIYNNYSMSPSWIWSDKITNERVAPVGYNHFISNKGEWNNCFSKFSNRVLPPIFISTILQRVRKKNLTHYFPYDVKLGLLAHSRSFLANQKARNAIVGAENLLNGIIHI